MNNKRLKKNVSYFKNAYAVSKQAQKEIFIGLKELNKIDGKIVSFFGSHITDPKDKQYRHAEHVAYELGTKGYTIITGGGPGIMHAANAGATRAGAHSIGFKAGLIESEQPSFGVYTSQISFKYLFVRRFVLAVKSEALIFYPGGFGTLNELFEYIVLIETHMNDAVPMVCVDKKYWKGLFEWLKKDPMKHKYLRKDYLKFVHLVDDYKEILSIIGK